MKNYFFSISTIIVLLLSSCSSDNFETQQELTNVSLKRKQNHINYSDAKKLAEDYTKSIYTLFDKLEENKFKNENEAFEFSISYMQESNNYILKEYGYNGILDYSDITSVNNKIDVYDISKLEISDIEKHYLTSLYKYHLEQNDTDLINLTDAFIRDIEIYNELESLSFYFALIDVNRDLFSPSIHKSSKQNCTKQSIASGALGGAVGGGLIVFFTGAAKGYLTCRIANGQ